MKEAPCFVVSYGANAATYSTSHFVKELLFLLVRNDYKSELSSFGLCCSCRSEFLLISMAPMDLNWKGV